MSFPATILQFSTQWFLFLHNYPVLIGLLEERDKYDDHLDNISCHIEQVTSIQFFVVKISVGHLINLLINSKLVKSAILSFLFAAFKKFSAIVQKFTNSNFLI